MVNKICIYPRFNPYELPVRWGRSYATVDAAIHKARQLRAFSVEIRDTHKPYSKGLLAVLKGGRDVVATPGA